MRLTAIALFAVAISSCAPSGVAPESAGGARAGAVEAAQSDASCTRVIESIENYRSESGWSIVTRRDLLSTDEELWNEYYDVSLCPGVAEIDLDGDSASEFAITEVRRDGDQVAQRLTVYWPSRGSTDVIWQAEAVPFAYVVLKTNEREASDFYPGEVTRIPHGSFAFQRMEAWTVIYFEAEGELRHVLVSD